MSSIKLQGATSGEITVTVPSVAGTNTLTLPANTGTIVTSVSGVGDLPSTIAGPVFSAYLGSDQTISNSTSTKLQINTEEFDTNSNFDNVTNYRFTPTVTGYYQVNGLVSYGSSASGMGAIFIYKNGVRFKDGVSAPFNSSDNLRVNVSTVVYLNGSTDYIELYTFQNSGGNKDASSYYTYFSASLVRAA